VIGVLTLTLACCLGWIRHRRSIDASTQLEWIEMSFLGTAIIVSLNTNPSDRSGLQWIISLCAIVLLYAAGIGASMGVEKLLRQQTKDVAPEGSRPTESNGAQA
jgi:hypothetical protein